MFHGIKPTLSFDEKNLTKSTSSQTLNSLILAFWITFFFFLSPLFFGTLSIFRFHIFMLIYYWKQMIGSYYYYACGIYFLVTLLFLKTRSLNTFSEKKILFLNSFSFTSFVLDLSKHYVTKFESLLMWMDMKGVKKLNLINNYISFFIEVKLLN